MCFQPKCTFRALFNCKEQTHPNKRVLRDAVAALIAARFPCAPSEPPRVFLQVPRWRRQAAPVALELPACGVDAGILDADRHRTLYSAVLQHEPYKVLLLGLHVPTAPRLLAGISPPYLQVVASVPPRQHRTACFPATLI